MTESLKSTPYISLEPYIAGGGVLGERLALTPRAERFMQVADVKRPVLIERGSIPGDKQVVSMGEVAAFKKVVSPHELVALITNRHSNSLLIRYPDRYVIKVDDQALIQRQNEKLNAPFSPDVYVGDLSHEVSGALSSLLVKEKLRMPRYWAGTHVMMLGATPLLAMDIAIYVNKPTLENAGAIGGLFGLFFFMNAYMNGVSKYSPDFPEMLQLQGDDHILRSYIPAFFLPVVPIDKLLRGKLFLAQHGQELVQLAPQK